MKTIAPSEVNDGSVCFCRYGFTCLCCCWLHMWCVRGWRNSLDSSVSPVNVQWCSPGYIAWMKTIARSEINDGSVFFCIYGFTFLDVVVDSTNDVCAGVEGTNSVDSWMSPYVEWCSLEHVAWMKTIALSKIEHGSAFFCRYRFICLGCCCWLHKWCVGVDV